METFEQTVQDVNEKTRESPQLANEKKALAPTLTTLEKMWKVFQPEFLKLEQTCQQAQERHRQALVAGVCHQKLAYLVKEAYGDGKLPGLLQNIPTDYESVIQKIKRLSEQDLSFVNVIKGLYGEPDRLRANIGSLKKVAAEMETITREGGELHQMLMTAATK